MIYWVTGSDQLLLLALLRALPRSPMAASPDGAAHRGADRLRRVPEGDRPPAARLGRAHLQHPALDGDAGGRPLRGDGGARGARGRDQGVLPSLTLIYSPPPAPAHAPAGGPTMRHTRFVTSFLAAVLLIAAPLAFADETCNSPYMAQADQGPGGLRLRLDARASRAWATARTSWSPSTSIPKSKTLRQGDPPGLGRRARRGAPHGLHRRPPLPLGRRPRRAARSTSSTSAPIPPSPSS